jgi:hypothetical protein
MTDHHYLWDPSSAPDPEVAQLERALRRYRLGAPARMPDGLARMELERPFATDDARALDHARPPRRRTLRALGVAAAVVAAFMIVGIGVTRVRARPWRVATVAGHARIGGTSLDEPRALRPGEWIETEAGSSARLDVGRIGRAEIGPASRVQLVRAEGTEHRLALARGTLHARIWAPPRFFLVETPSAVAVDLGCVYTLTVDSLGEGMLRVESGEVELVGRYGSVLVPAGNRAALRAGMGPGLPTSATADAEYDRLLAALDAGTFDSASVARLLDASGPQRTITLWHLAKRVDGHERAMVVDRLMRLAPPPSSVTRAELLAGDRAAWNEWREVLTPSWSSERVPLWKEWWRRAWSRR